MRVLHLIDLREQSDEAQVACRAAVTTVPGRHRVLALGSSADVTAARGNGLPVDAAAPVVGPMPEFSCRRLRRLLGDRDGRDATRPWADVVQCWSPTMLSVARLSSGQRTPPRIGALLRPPVRDLDGLTRTRLRYGLHDATLFAPDRFTRAAWSEPASARRGGRLLEQNIRLLDPATAGSTEIPTEVRVHAREELGLHPDDTAIALLADPPEAGDVTRFAFLLGLLFTTGVRVVGLVRRGGTHERRASRFVRLHGRRWGLEFTSKPTDFLLAACDLAVWDVGETNRGGIVSAGALSIGRAITLGIPVIAARHPLSTEILGPIRPDLLARDATLSAIAERLLPLSQDTAARADLGRQLATSSRPDHAFAPELRRLWEEVTNTPVVRPGLPAPIELRGRLEGAA